MAAKEVEPPDKLEKKTCCKRKNAAVVCLICDKKYHGSCYSAVSDKFFINDSLVICPDHEDPNLTSILTSSKILLSENARYLIAQIKLKKQEEAKQDILNEIANESLNEHNKTIHEDKTELEVLKIENTILKQLNTELRDKILLLKELLAIEKSKDNKLSATKSFAEIVTNTNPPLKRIQ